jgi:hypothetical protein
VSIARALAEEKELVVVDEFTSVVDRTVAKVGSAAIAKSVRASKRRFVAIACHYDILDWLQPDWVFDTGANEFDWRLVQRRPAIQVEVTRVHRKAWQLFSHHHYLNTDIHSGAGCFLGTVEGRPAAFTSILSFAHPIRPGWRGHRTVCLPDYQGVGIGNALTEFVAGMCRATGKPYFSTTGNPAMIRHRAKSPLWKMLRAPSRVTGHNGAARFVGSSSNKRLTAGFEYLGPPKPEEARQLGLKVVETNVTSRAHRLRARKLMKEACEACGYGERLHAHHIDQNVENNTEENVQTLCQSCHDFWHTRQKRLGLEIAGRMPSLSEAGG